MIHDNKYRDFLQIACMKVPKEILDQIADNLESGLKSFLHKETFEVISFPDEDSFPGMDSELWQEEFDKLENDESGNFFEIKKMESSESYKVMEDFVYSIDDSQVKAKLIQAIEGYKPFANFKHQLLNAGEYRKLWFQYSRERLVEFVRDQLSVDLL